MFKRKELVRTAACHCSACLRSPVSAAVEECCCYALCSLKISEHDKFSPPHPLIHGWVICGLHYTIHTILSACLFPFYFSLSSAGLYPSLLSPPLFPIALFLSHTSCVSPLQHSHHNIWCFLVACKHPGPPGGLAADRLQGPNKHQIQRNCSPTLQY